MPTQAARAAALGWGPRDLFSCDRARPIRPNRPCRPIVAMARPNTGRAISGYGGLRWRAPPARVPTLFVRHRGTGRDT